MAQRFNPPPGWPQPPAGWSPPADWQPDPSWPPAPAGWQFWVDDSAVPSATSAAPSAQSGAEQPPHASSGQEGAGQFGGPAAGTAPAWEAGATEQFSAPPSYDAPQQFSAPSGPAPTQEFGAPGYNAAPYDNYGQGAGFNGQPAYGAPPPANSGGEFGGPSEQWGPGGGPGGTGPNTKSKQKKGPLIIFGVVGLLLIGGLVWGAIALLGGNDDPEPTVEPSPTESEEPTSEDPTEDPTDEPTSEDPTEDPTDDPTTAAPSGDVLDASTVGAGEFLDVQIGQAVKYWYLGAEAGTLTVHGIEPDFEPTNAGSLCDPPENGQFLALDIEMALDDGLNDSDWENAYFFGRDFDVVAGGRALTSADADDWAGIWCLPSDEQLPSSLNPNETVRGYVLFDTVADAEALWLEPDLSWGDEGGTYRWNF